MKKIICFILFFGFSLTQCFADEAGQCSFNGINYQAATSFVTQLKAALKNHDKNKVAELIKYPLRINTQSAKTKKTIFYYIKTKRDFLNQYETIFTQTNVKSVLSDNEIFCNYQGAMLAGGFIWFDGTKIFTINK